MRGACGKIEAVSLLSAAIAFCVSFSLALSGSAWISRTLGDQALPGPGNVSGWVSFVFQPWILLALRIGLHTGWVSSIVIGFLSSLILAALSWRILRSYRWVLWVVVGLWVILTILNVWDLQQTTEIRNEFEGEFRHHS